VCVCVCVCMPLVNNLIGHPYSDCTWYVSWRHSSENIHTFRTRSQKSTLQSFHVANCVAIWRWRIYIDYTQTHKNMYYSYDFEEYIYYIHYTQTQHTHITYTLSKVSSIVVWREKSSWRVDFGEYTYTMHRLSKVSPTVISRGKLRGEMIWEDIYAVRT